MADYKYYQGLARLLVCTISAFALLTIAVQNTARAEPQKSAAIVASVSGMAKIQHGNNGDGRAVSVNEQVFPGDVLSTGDTGALKMIFSDDSVIDLGPHSSFKVDQFAASGPGDRTAVFTVLYGKLRALVTHAISPSSKMEVRTSDAVMGVRGTEFIINAPQAGSGSTKTDVAVVTGALAVTIPKLKAPPISLGSGMQASAFAGMSAAPKPTALSLSQLTNLSQGARVRDNTFERTISLDAGVQNEKAPAAASSRSLAVTNLSTAKESISEKSADSLKVSSTGTFSVLDTMSTVPVTLIPGNFQVVTVRLSH